MHDEARRFVDHEHVFIFVHDGEIDVLRLDAILSRQYGIDLDLLPAEHLVLRPKLYAVDAHVAGVDPVLDSGPRVVAEEVCERLIQPLPRVLERDRQAMSDGCGHRGTSRANGERS